MKKSAVLSMVAVLALALGGCGAPKTAPKVTLEPLTACTYDGTNTEAPLWVCDGEVEGIPVSAVGIQMKSKAGPGFMRNQAMLDGRAKLAASFKVYVEDMLKRYTAITGIGDAETVDNAQSQTTKLITKETLNGSKVFATSTNPEDGTLYVLVGLDENVARAAAKSLIATSFKNDQALWQEFKSQKSFEELADEISKIPAQ